MQRLRMTPRRDWQTTAEKHGFDFHSPEGTAYWDETACYRFTLEQIERDLEAPAEEVEQMCLSIVDEAVRSETILRRLAVPEAFWDYVAASWRNQERNLYGRMDFAYDGSGPARLYEYNADTPTSLYESAVFQWLWLEQMRDRGELKRDSDQFNSLHERLIEAWRNIGVHGHLHLAAVGSSREDFGTIAYLADCANQAGLHTSMIAIEDIGVSADRRFTDRDDRVIDTLFKLYPWEWLMRESFSRHIPGSGCRFIEPAWKSILSNKGLLALLWERFPGHPNLLPAYFDGDPRASDLPSRYVRKPLYSREGANVTVVDRRWKQPIEANSGTYGEEGHVVQAFHALPTFGSCRPMCGIWIVASQAAGLGIREDMSAITTDAARFVPHLTAA
jgi:glutathionylspermidine synthase